MPNKIAVIICVYKNDKLTYLSEMFESLFAQTFQEFDIFVQEDGQVVPEIDEYLDNLQTSKRVAYIGRRDANIGLAASLNELLNEVLKKNYEYIVRMDADDICDKSRIELQYEFMEMNRNIDIVGSWMLEFNEDDGQRQIVKYPEKHEQIFQFMIKRCPMAHTTVFFRRSFFDKAGLYPTNTILNEDGGLWFNGFKNNCLFHNLQLPLVEVRINSSFYSRRSGFNKAWEDFKLKAAISKEFSFGFPGYFYAVAYAALLLFPPTIKKYCYEKFRE